MNRWRFKLHLPIYDSTIRLLSFKSAQRNIHIGFNKKNYEVGIPEQNRVLHRGVQSIESQGRVAKQPRLIPDKPITA
jgi:hypothetical protein